MQFPVPFQDSKDDDADVNEYPFPGVMPHQHYAGYQHHPAVIPPEDDLTLQKYPPFTQGESQILSEFVKSTTDRHDWANYLAFHFLRWTDDRKDNRLSAIAIQMEAVGLLDRIADSYAIVHHKGITYTQSETCKFRARVTLAYIARNRGQSA